MTTEPKLCEECDGSGSVESDCCHCGTLLSQHNINSGHSAVPLPERCEKCLGTGFYPPTSSNSEPCNGECHADCDPYPACEQKLIPCPFCGSPGGERIWEDGAVCSNKNCVLHDRPIPIAVWNRRALPDREALQKRVADLVLAAVEDSRRKTAVYTVDGADIWETADRILALLEGKPEPDTTPNFTRANLHEPIERALASFALMLSDLFLGKTEDTFIQIRTRAVDHILNLVDYHSMSPQQRMFKNRQTPQRPDGMPYNRDNE